MSCRRSGRSRPALVPFRGRLEMPLTGLNGALTPALVGARCPPRPTLGTPRTALRNRTDASPRSEVPQIRLAVAPRGLGARKPASFPPRAETVCCQEAILRHSASSGKPSTSVIEAEWRCRIGERTLVRQNRRQPILGASKSSDPSVSEDEKQAKACFSQSRPHRRRIFPAPSDLA